MSNRLKIVALIVVAICVNCRSLSTKNSGKLVSGIDNKKKEFIQKLGEFSLVCDSNEENVKKFNLRNSILNMRCEEENLNKIIEMYEGRLCGMISSNMQSKLNKHARLNDAESYFNKLNFNKKNIVINNELKPNVFHLSLEYTDKSHNGGVGTVVQQVSRGQLKISNETPNVITPFYDFWKKDKNKSEFVGCLRFPFENQVRQAIVYRTQSNEGIDHYLIAPDNQSELLFDVPERQVYSNGAWERLVYFSAAAAKFLAVLNINNAPVIAHFHNPVISGITSTLIKEVYNPKRKKAGMMEIGMFTLGHGAAVNDDFPATVDYLSDVGLEFDYPHEEIKYLGLAFLNSHAVGWVSEAQRVASKTENFNFNIRDIATFLESEGIYYGITNGIEADLFSIDSKTAYHDFSLDKKSLSDIASAKKRMKIELYNQGIIADPEKPLFLFVGRYSHYVKGIDFLPAMLEVIKHNNAQAVIMGLVVDGEKNNTMEWLREFALKNNNILKFYEKKNDQTDLFEIDGSKSGFNKGMAIRYASSVMMLPSRTEGAPMVVQELFSVGAVLVASDVGGIVDYAVPYSTGGNNKFFNSVLFAFSKNKLKMEAGAVGAMNTIFNQYVSKSDDFKNIIMKSLVEKVHSRWDWTSTSGPLKDLSLAYKKIIERLSSQKELERYYDNQKRTYLKYFNIDNYPFRYES